MAGTSLKKRLYKIILLFGMGLSLLSIIGNNLTGFPQRANLKWILLFLICLIAMSLLNKPQNKRMMFTVFLFCICVFLPLAFVDSGGSQNNAIGYTFFILIAMTYLFEGKRRVLLFALLVGAFMGMHAFEYYYPHLIPVYPEKTQFMDRMIQIPLLLLASFLVIRRFALEYESANRKLRALAAQDALTSLHNRRAFNQALQEAIEKREKGKYLILLDLDNFKQINDIFGHQVGDKVLQELARILKENFSQAKQLISRWGGDEFAIIYQGSLLEMQNILQKVKNEFLRRTYSLYSDLDITISWVDCLDFKSPEEALKAVDEKLYREKSLRKK